MRLRKLLDLYSEQRDVEPGTKKWLAVALGRFERHLTRPAELADLNDAALNEWAAAEIASGSIARRTVKGYRGGVIMLWRFAVDEDLIDRPPFKLRRIKLPKMIPCAWHPAEAASLLPLAQMMTGNYACGVVALSRKRRGGRSRFSFQPPRWWLSARFKIRPGHWCSAGSSARRRFTRRWASYPSRPD
jgi:hypothetical protein